MTSEQVLWMGIGAITAGVIVGVGGLLGWALSRLALRLFTQPEGDTGGTDSWELDQPLM